MILLTLSSLALIGLAGAAPTNPMPAGRAIVADSERLLTTDQVTNYIAVKKALAPYWQAPENANLKNVAASGAHCVMLRFGQAGQEVCAYNYPSLVKQDQTLATLFATNHFAPEQFEQTQVALTNALATLFMVQHWRTAMPASSTVLGKNVELVKARSEELEEAGIRARPIGLLVNDEQVTNYIAVKKALRSYWKAPEHAKLVPIAHATEFYPPFPAVGQWWELVGRVNDYPNLIKQDPALAAVFVTNHFAPEQFGWTQIAVHQAMMELDANEVNGAKYHLPDGSTLVGKNIELIKEHRVELEAVGVMPYIYTHIPTLLLGTADLTHSTAGFIELPGGFPNVLIVNNMDP